MSRVVVTGAFDVIHVGYIRLLREANNYGDHLTVLLHHDPSLENKNKNKPVFSDSDRTEVLLGLKFVDDVVVYHTEDDLKEILQSGIFDIRVNGSDHEDDDPYKDLIETVYHKRDHLWSSTYYKDRIAEKYHE